VKRPKPWLVNTALGVGLVGAGLVAFFSIGDPTQAQTSTARRATAATGTLTASVSGTGNSQSASSTGVNFVSAGTLSAVYVHVGQQVNEGQKLARIDAAVARQSLQTARAQLASVQAQYDQTVQGATTVQQQKDQLAVQSAQLSVNSAKNTLSNARQQLSLDTATQNQLVAAAEANLKAKTGTQAQVDQAKNARTSTLAKDRQAITAAQQQVASANNQLSQQKLTAAADSAPTAPALAQARASLNSAKVSVAQAQLAADNTLLTAPQSGTVVSISAKVGQTVSGGGATASSSSSGSSSGSTGSAGSNSGSNGSSTSSSSSSGFITIADLSTMTVTTNIAEADAASVKVGQSATVTFSATGTIVSGQVTQVSLTSITSSNVIQYPITVTLKNAPDTVKLGASTNVSVVTGSVENALYVLSSAVTTLGRNHTVTLVNGATETVVPVEIGLVGDRGTQILSGLKDGDVVVLPASTSTTSGGSGFPRLGGGLGSIGGRG